MGEILAGVNRSETYAGYSRLEIEVCGSCGILFAAPEVLLDHARDDHSIGFYCPNGHRLFYLGKTKAQKLQDKLDNERARAGRVAAERDQLQASLTATKGVVTKQRKKLARVANGVCPCCNRSFTDLQRHMDTKHPDYAPAATPT